MGRKRFIGFCFVALILLPHISSAAEWSAWQQQKTVVVHETAGIDRVHEPVECEVQFYQTISNGDPSTVEDDIKRELRLLLLGPDGTMTEISSQAFDIRRSTPRRELSSIENMPEDKVFIRMRIAFFVDVKAFETVRFRVLLDNPDATQPKYSSGLAVSGGGVGYTVDNGYYKIQTEEKSGQINQIDLKFATKPTFTNPYGTLHWNPDFIVAPDDFPTTGYVWRYASHFENPDTEIESGPVFFSIRRKQLIPGQDTVYMDVYYRFYDGLPYFIMESYSEAKKRTKTFAIRNDELSFSQKDFNSAFWRIKTPDMMENHDGEVGSTVIYHDARVGDHVLGSALPPNIAWISFAHMDNQYGVGSIRLDWKNVNTLTDNPSPLYNSHTVISQHGGLVYWFRSLVYSYRIIEGVDTDTIRSRLIDIPEGSSYYEKNAYLMYEFDSEDKYVPVDDLWRKLRKPCSVIVLSE